MKAINKLAVLVIATGLAASVGCHDSASKSGKSNKVQTEAVKKTLEETVASAIELRDAMDQKIEGLEAEITKTEFDIIMIKKEVGDAEVNLADADSALEEVAAQNLLDSKNDSLDLLEEKLFSTADDLSEAIAIRDSQQKVIDAAAKLAHQEEAGKLTSDEGFDLPEDKGHTSDDGFRTKVIETKFDGKAQRNEDLEIGNRKRGSLNVETTSITNFDGPKLREDKKEGSFSTVTVRNKPTMPSNSESGLDRNAPVKKEDLSPQSSGYNRN